jgi:hypothetical protein
MRKLTVANPSQPGRRYVVIASGNPAQITDRAKRYRAQSAITQKEKRCIYCGVPGGARRKLDVEHINGDESDENPANLGYGCRPCNTVKGAVFAKAGRGVKTRQYNPAKKMAGATRYQQYVKAVLTTKGYQTGMTLDSAIELLQHTSPEKRSSFAKQIYQVRRERQGELPF